MPTKSPPPVLGAKKPPLPKLIGPVNPKYPSKVLPMVLPSV
jgi:hypothetical protein